MTNHTLELMFNVAMCLVLVAIFYYIKHKEDISRSKKIYPKIRKGDKVKVIQLDEHEEKIA